MRREDRSSIVVSCSRRTRRVRFGDYVIDSSPRFALFLCSCLAAVPSSRPAGSELRRAQGPSRLAVARSLPLARALPGHALTGLSTAQGLSGLGRRYMSVDGSLSEVGGPNLAVYRWQVSEPFAGSDASRVNTSVRGDVVDLSARGADVHQLRVA
jgi:hypothetical protein